MKAKAEITKRTTRAREIQQPMQPCDDATAKYNAKKITLAALRDLKAKLYAQADAAVRATDPRDPQKIIRIQRRVDRDAAHIAFAINAVSVKI